MDFASKKVVGAQEKYKTKLLCYGSIQKKHSSAIFWVLNDLGLLISLWLKHKLQWQIDTLIPTFQGKTEH